ncbi:MAG TPA: LppP/LprE family lipoprotein [Vicinamibacterales bacterium]
MTFVRTATFIVTILGFQAGSTAQPKPAAWLDEAKPASWNKPGLPIPSAPKVDEPVDPRCREQARPPQLTEDRLVRDRGWDLIGAFEGGWDVVVIQGTAGYDGMCRPRRYQAFVFVRGEFAGTLSPQPMESRTDGALDRIFLGGRTQLTAQYRRYSPSDALCCPSKTTSVEFAISSAPALVTPTSASTYK